MQLFAMSFADQRDSYLVTQDSLVILLPKSAEIFDEHLTLIEIPGQHCVQEAKRPEQDVFLQ